MVVSVDCPFRDSCSSSSSSIFHLFSMAASGVAANAKYDQGVAVFTLLESGAMVKTAWAGKKFRFAPMK
jgi:hypothetical protein